MNKPEQQQIDYLIEVAKERIQRKHQLYSENFYKKKNITIQTHYCGLAGWHASLARSKFLNGDPIEEVRAEFSNASRCILKSFTIAYDEEDPDYVGDKWPAKNPHYTGLEGSVVEAKWLKPKHGQVDFSEVSETIAIRGINHALMGADFELAKELASWFRDRPNGKKKDLEVNNFAHDLKRVLVDSPAKAEAELKGRLEAYMMEPPKRDDYRKNYYTFTTALRGIAGKDEACFNRGLLMVVNFYQRVASSEYKNTDEEFICDYAVALANLGVYHGLSVNVEHDTLPKGLLLASDI